MKVAQLTAAGIVMDVIEGKNLNKVFEKYSHENKINSKDISQIKDLVFGTLRSYGKTKFVINKLEAIADLNNSPEVLCQKIRAFNPFPMVNINFEGKSLKIVKAKIYNKEIKKNLASGKLFLQGEDLLLSKVLIIDAPNLDSLLDKKSVVSSVEIGTFSFIIIGPASS